ncbi:hypothetical protein V2J09_024268 [Rumex salicifolius]
MKRQILRLPPRPAGRDRIYGDEMTPEIVLSPDSPDSSYSSTSSQKQPSRASSAIRYAAKSFVGAFSGCIIPLDYDSLSQVSFDSHHTKPASAPTSVHNGSVRDGLRHNCKKAGEQQAHDTKFTLEVIHKATMNFSPSLKIGQGGFGTVYKGTLHDGRTVAIKRAKKGAYDNDHMGAEFRREVEMLAQVKHLGLVQLLGFLEEGDERILIVEYVSNGSLREHLDGKRGDILDFSVRFDIAVDLAHAITYLHTYTDHPIIHRDIKASNILLTDICRVKVADFGFARLAADRDSDDTHVSTQVKGTAGYLDPQYMKTRQLTDKSDVYSFGVLLVELFSGRRPIQPRSEYKDRVTAIWAIKKLMDGNAISVLDPRLEKDSANEWALERILELALQCLQSTRDSRPSMKSCAEILGSIRKQYREKSSKSHSRNSSVTEE